MMLSQTYCVVPLVISPSWRAEASARCQTLPEESFHNKVSFLLGNSLEIEIIFHIAYPCSTSLAFLIFGLEFERCS